MLSWDRSRKNARYLKMRKDCVQWRRGRAGHARLIGEVLGMFGFVTVTTARDAARWLIPQGQGHGLDAGISLWRDCCVIAPPRRPAALANRRAARVRVEGLGRL